MTAPAAKNEARFFARTGWRGNLLVMLPFLLLFYVQLAGHVLWRDEINPWGIACISPTLSELLRRVHYEAHPAFWYVLLWAATRVTHALWMLKLIQAVVGTGIFVALALLTPLRRLELALIFAGFYVSFEYTVLTRMYGLEVLAALVYMSFRLRRPEWVARNTLWLCFMVNLDTTAGILAAALGLEYLRFLRRERGATLRQMMLPVGLFVAACALAVATLWPAKNIGWVSTGGLGATLLDPVHLGIALALWGGLAWFPQVVSPISLWSDLHPWPDALLVPVALLLLWLALRKFPPERFFYASVLVMGIAFSQLLSVAGVRHIGMVTVAFVLCLWMIRARGEAVSAWSYVLLGLLVVANGQILAAGWHRPFADDDAAADWIRAQGPQEMPLIASPDTMTIGVPIRLERRVYQLDCRCFDRVLTFAKRRDAFNVNSEAALAERLREFPGRSLEGMDAWHTDDALFLTNRALGPEVLEAYAAEGLPAKLVASFDRGVLPDEHFFLYRLRRVR